MSDTHYETVYDDKWQPPIEDMLKMIVEGAPFQIVRGEGNDVLLMVGRTDDGEVMTMCDPARVRSTGNSIGYMFHLLAGALLKVQEES